MVTLTRKEIEKLCQAGEAAPSGGNAQPWKVTIEDGTFTIGLDEKRAESFIDVGQYASFFGVGCFLENVLIQAESLGLKYSIQIHDFKNIKEPLVTLTFTSRETITDLHPLQPFIERRVTNRHIYNGEIIEQTRINRLMNIINGSEFKDNYGIAMENSFQDKKKIVAALGEADAIRILNDSAYKEMMSEFRWSEEEVVKTQNGLDMKTLELPKNAEKLYRLLKEYPFLKQILPRKALTDMAKPLLIGSSHLCCLYTTQKISPKVMLTAGRVFERLWLTATKEKIALQPWSILPFFLLRKNVFAGKGFSKDEVATLDKIEKKLLQAFSYKHTHTPLFIFRLSITDKAPSAHSRRLPWQSFTKIVNA